MKRDTFTVVLVTESREPLTIEFSIKELLLISILLLTLIGAAVFSFVNYRKLKNQYTQIQGTIELLEQNLQSREKQITELQGKVESQKGLVLLVGPQQDTSMVSPGINTQDVLIQDLKVNTREDSLFLSFNLINNTKQDKLISGYLIIIAEHKSGTYDKFGTFPGFKLQSGEPLNYRLGDTFAIRYFKVVQAAINLPDSPANYNRLKVLVFSDEGRVLLYDRRVLEW